MNYQLLQLEAAQAQRLRDQKLDDDVALQAIQAQIDQLKAENEFLKSELPPKALLQSIQNVLNGAATLPEPEPQEIEAATATAAAEGEIRLTFDLALQAGGGYVLSYANFEPVVTAQEFVDDAGVDAPTILGTPRISNGRMKLEALLHTGGLTYQAGVAAAGSIDCDSAAATVTVLDGETVVLDDGTNPAVTFEFDTDTSVVETDTLRAVDVSAALSDDDVKSALISAINGAPTLDITASDGGAGIVSLVNDAIGAAGNVAIAETVVSANFVVTGMTGGLDADRVQLNVDVSDLPGLENVVPAACVVNFV